MPRRHRLIDCNPRWRTWSGRDGADAVDAVMFDCPEGHADCHHIIPFTPALDGSAQPVKQTNGAQWQRSGDTFETLSLSPSIRRIPHHPTRAAAIAAGCIEEYITDSLLCACHIFITNGQIVFCSDSGPPDMKGIRISPIVIPCRRCDARPGESCTRVDGRDRFTLVHKVRERDAERTSDLLDL